MQSSNLSSPGSQYGFSPDYLPLSAAERPRFASLEAGLRAEINPQGALQESVFRELAAAAWKRDTVNRLLAQAGGSTEELYSSQPDQRALQLQRHKTQLERDFNRAIRLLKELQTNALLRAGNPSLDPDDCPGLADYAKITKQSRASAVSASTQTDGFLQQVNAGAQAVGEEYIAYCKAIFDKQQQPPRAA